MMGITPVRRVEQGREMTPERYEEIKQHIQYFEDGSPLKDFENVEQLVGELWNEVEQIRAKIMRYEHDIDHVLWCQHSQLCIDCRRLLHRGVSMTPQECLEERQ